MQNTKQYLGARIQEIRRHRGLKQAELAEILGIDSKHISKIECGRCFPSFELLDKIAFALKTPVQDFFETEHLQDKSLLIERIVENLKMAPDEKFYMAYKILKEIL